MAKPSKRQKFLRESSSSSSKSWQFNEQQLNQIESLYGANVRSIYEIEKTPPQQLSSKRRNFLSMTGKLGDYSSARLGGSSNVSCGIISSQHSNIYWYQDPSSAATTGAMIIPNLPDPDEILTEVARYDNKIWVGAGRFWGTTSQQNLGIYEYDFDETNLTTNLTTVYTGVYWGCLSAVNATTLISAKQPLSSVYCTADTTDPNFNPAAAVRLEKIDLSSGTAVATTVFQTNWMCGPRDTLYIPSSDTYLIVGSGALHINDTCHGGDQVMHFDSSGNLLGRAQLCEAGLSFGISWLEGGYSSTHSYPFSGGVYNNGTSYAAFCHNGEIYIAVSGPNHPMGYGHLQNRQLFILDLPTMTFSPSVITDASPIWGDAASNPECCDGAYIVPTWDCDGQGNCYDPGTGNGQYTTLNDCENNCFPPTWRCTNTNQGCLPNPLNTDPAIYGPNVYYSLQDCENDCYVKRWTCTGRQFAPLNCVMSSHLANAVPSGPGIYSSPAACNANCNQTTWNCTLTGCVDPGDQSGQYFHLNACEDACTVYQCQNLASQGPSTGSIPGCVPFQGGQVTLNAGLSAGQLWYNNIWDCQAHCYNPSWNCKYDPGQVNQLPTWNCVDPLDGSGSFSLLVDCQNNCGPDPVRGPGYDCDDALGCIPHVGPGQGQYTTLAACQAAPGPCYKP